MTETETSEDEEGSRCGLDFLDILIPAERAGLTDEDLLVDPHLGYIFTLAGVVKLLRNPPDGEDGELFFRYADRGLRPN